MRRERWRGLVLASAAALALACSESAGPTTAPGAEELAARGKQAYLSNCIACHNADPTVDGALGPAVAGASEALLEARVMRGEYPPGYTPKRDTRAMIAMPFLERQITGLAAYLAAAAQ